MRIVSTILTTPLLAACAVASARRGPAVEAADRAALLRLHEQHRAAHFDRRADLLVASQADSLLSVSGGRISTSSRDSVRASFQEYFDQSTFQAWDDATPPLVERVRYAWLSVYEKRGGEWRMTAIASTERPDST